MPNAVLRRVAVHDRYQLELKLGYPLNPASATRYRIDTYFFAPYSLGIGASTYSRSEFYRDIQHYMRMKTPRLSLAQVLGDSISPLRRSAEILKSCAVPLDAYTQEQLRDNLRILWAILKIACQSHIAPLAHLSQPPPVDAAARYEEIVESLLGDFQAIEERFHSLSSQLTATGASAHLLHVYHLTDESISILFEDVLLQAHQFADHWLDMPRRSEWQARLAMRVRSGAAYRQAQGYPSVLRRQGNDDYLLRLSALKKFPSNVLWLVTSTRREGATLEQLLFATVAGLSMVFATLVAFYAQSLYGQFTAPVFLALVIAYMFKDRLKEEGRAVSMRLLSQRLFDYRTTIHTHDGQQKIGQVREKMNHVDPRVLPPAVVAARTAGPYTELEFTGNPESVIHYSKLVELRKDAFRDLSGSGLEISAINDIMRFDVHPFLRKMDDPFQLRLALLGDKVQSVRCHRTYHINLVSVFQGEDGTATYERTLLVVDRRGIQRIEQYDAEGAPSLGQQPAALGEELSEIDYGLSDDQ